VGRRLVQGLEGQIGQPLREGMLLGKQ
jgi:hypothetical protein